MVNPHWANGLDWSTHTHKRNRLRFTTMRPTLWIISAAHHTRSSIHVHRFARSYLRGTQKRVTTPGPTSQWIRVEELSTLENSTQAIFQNFQLAKSAKMLFIWHSRHQDTLCVPPHTAIHLTSMVPHRFPPNLSKSHLIDMGSHFIQNQKPAINRVILISDIFRQGRPWERKTVAKNSINGIIKRTRPQNSRWECTQSTRASLSRRHRVAKSLSSPLVARSTSMDTKAPLTRPTRPIFNLRQRRNKSLKNCD